MGTHTELNSVTQTRLQIRRDGNLHSRNAVFVTCTSLLVYLNLGCYNAWTSVVVRGVETWWGNFVKL